MGNAPSDYNVEAVVGAEPWSGQDEPMVTFEVTLAELPGRTVKVIQKASDPPVAAGPVRGWLDLSKGKLGIAKDRPEGQRTASSNGATGGGRDTATERSIERQTAAKAVAEILAGQGFVKETFPADVRFMVDAVYDAIRGE